MINDFRGAHGFLSNFYGSEVELDGVMYPTVEHAFQAAKSIDARDREMIRLAPTPGKAKRLGRAVSLRPDWEDVKLAVMADLLADKFTRHPVLRQKLLATRGKKLVEGNTWGDTYWGVCRGKGQNKLGVLLMCIRETGIQGGM